MSSIDLGNELSSLEFEAVADATESGAGLETLAPELFIKVAGNLDLKAIADLCNTSSHLRIIVKTNPSHICNAIVKIRLAALPGGVGNESAWIFPTKELLQSRELQLRRGFQLKPCEKGWFGYLTRHSPRFLYYLGSETINIRHYERKIRHLKLTDDEIAGLSEEEAKENLAKLESADEWLACFTGMTLHATRALLSFPQIPRTKQLIWYFGVEKMKNMEWEQIKKVHKQALEAALHRGKNGGLDST